MPPLDGISPAEFFGGGAGMSPGPQAPAGAAPVPPQGVPALPAASGGGMSAAEFFGSSKSAAAPPLSTPAAPASKPITGVLANIGAGANDQLATIAGAPADIVAGALNAGFRGIKSATGYDIGQITHPFGGSDSIKTALGWIGADPRNVQPTDDVQRYARAAGGAAAGMLVPGLGVAALPEAAGALGAVQKGVAAGMAPSAVAAGAVGGVTGQAAEDAAPNGYKPLANMAGNVLGGGLAAAGEAGVRALGAGAYDRAGNLLRPMVGKAAPVLDQAGQPFLMSDIVGDPSAIQPVMATAGQARMAGARLNASATNPRAVLDALAEAKPLVPGSMPTTYQATNDPGLGQLETAAASTNRDIFTTRAAQQQQARAAYLQAGAGNGDPAAVGQLARSMLDNIQADSEAQTAAARQGAQGAADAMPGQVPASSDGATALQSFGAAMRDQLDQANQAAKANVSRMFNTWDPDGTAQFDMGQVKQAATDIMKSVGPNAAPLDGAEKAILLRARLMPTVQSASNFQDFYSRLGTTMRAARIDPAQAQSYGRLSQLMASMHGAVEDTVARAAENDPSMLNRMQGFVGGSADSGAQSLAAGQGYGGIPTPQSQSQPFGAAGDNRAGSTSGGGFGSAAGRSGIPKTERSTAPESLNSFLIRNGGVYDDGGDLASMGAGKLRVGLLRKRPDGPVPGQAGLGGGGFGGFNSGNSRAGEPMQLDYAREKAIEAGYLHPDADLTDFKAAIGEDLRGNRQYIPEEIGDWHAAGDGYNAGAEDHAFDNARGDVADAADRMGASLHPQEVEHAAKLAMLGVDPHEAVQQAADAGRRDYLAGRTFTGDLGMPEHASQSEIPTDAPAPPGAGFLTREQADALAAAKAAHADRISTYQRAPGVGGVLAPGPTAGTFKMSLSAVPSAIWSGGKGAAEKVSAYLRAGGSPDVLKDYAAFDLRKSATRGDGTVDPTKLQKWLGAHSEQMEAFPTLRRQFENAASATQAMDDAQAKGVAAVKAHQTSALGKFLGNAEPDRIVPRILAFDNAPAVMADLAGQVKNDPDALAGLRHAVMARYLPLVQGHAFEALPKALSKEWGAVSKVLTPEQMDMLKATQADLARSKASISGTKLAGTSNTTQDAQAIEAHSAGAHGGGGGGKNLISSILTASILEGGAEMAAHLVGGVGIVSHVASMGTMIAGATANALRQNGIQRVDDLVAYAAAHPGLARTLMMQAPKNAQGSAWKVLHGQLGALTANAGALVGRNLPPAPASSRRSAPADLLPVSAGRFN